MGQVKLLVPGAFVVVVVGLAVWAGSRSVSTAVAWRLAQAESITAVRGTPVHAVRCDGLGPVVDGGRYRRFACTAAARASFETYDSVGVTYVLRPLGPFAGASSSYALSDVRFTALSVP